MAIVATISKLEDIISKTTDTYIRHYESEIKYVQEKSQLSLWIIGLSIGMGLYVLEKVSNESMNNWFNKGLLIILGLIFLSNMFLGLILRIKQTRVYSHFLKVITLYDYQKTTILLNMDESVELGKKVISDFAEGIAIDKLKDLEYIGQKEEKKDPIAESDMGFLHASDNWSSTLLVVQALLTIVFVLRNI